MILRVSTYAFVLFATAACAPAARAQEISYAWWLRATFIPRHTMVEGIPVASLNSRWSRASVITHSDLPKDSREPGEGVEDHGFALSAEADLDGDGVSERAVVGVFETVAGETGEFLLILGRHSSNDAWTKRALFLDVGQAGFSAVTVQHRRLVWVRCFECDSACEVSYRARRFRRECHSCRSCG